MTLQNIQDISLIVLIICCLLRATAPFTCKKMKSKFFIPAMRLVVVLGVCSFITLCITNHKMAELELTTAIEEDWSFYINGIEVEPEDIYLDGYQVKYDKENQKVHLFPKRRNSW